MRIVYAPKARADLQTCIEYIAKDNPSAAVSLADRVFALINRLAAGEFDGPEHHLYNGQLFEVGPFRRFESITSDCRTSCASSASTTTPAGQLPAEPIPVCSKQYPLGGSTVPLPSPFPCSGNGHLTPYWPVTHVLSAPRFRPVPADF